MRRAVIDKVLLYIDKHIYEKITLTELSSIAGYSPFYFSALFSETMGISVTSYIRIRKLQYAMEALLTGEKIIDVSTKYAFESHAGFTRSFTRLFGSTPKTVRKYLTTYTVPNYVVPENSTKKGDDYMNITKNLSEDMHNILFAFVEESLEEMKLGHCSEIIIELLPENQVRITDDGRGIPLSSRQPILDDILAGHPITRFDYEKMEPFKSRGLKIANSLCEAVTFKVYRDGNVYEQNFIRGIAQHDITCEVTTHASGIEITLKPDKEIFGDIEFSREKIGYWAKSKLDIGVIKIL